MHRSWLRRSLMAGFVAMMALLAGWLVFELGHARGYFCAGVVVALTACLPLVRQGRHWLYAVGAVMCLATLTLAAWQTDPSPGGGLCGSVLDPHADREVIAMLAAEDGFDPDAYLQACDDEMARNRWLVAVGALLSVAVVGASLVPDDRSPSRRAGSSPRTADAAST